MNPMLIIIGAVAFVVGIAGGTAVRVMTAPKPVAAVAAADSTHAVHGTAPAGEHAAVAAHADSATHAAAPDSVKPPALPTPESAMQAAAANAGHGVPAHAASAGGPKVEKVPPDAAEVEAQTHAFKQVGSILLNMKPAEAAQILKYMSDDHLEGILRQMGPRQAAQVMAQIPAERAAALSRRLLVPEETTK